MPAGWNASCLLSILWSDKRRCGWKEGVNHLTKHSFMSKTHVAINAGHLPLSEHKGVPPFLLSPFQPTPFGYLTQLHNWGSSCCSWLCDWHLCQLKGWIRSSSLWLPTVLQTHPLMNQPEKKQGFIIWYNSISWIRMEALPHRHLQVPMNPTTTWVRWSQTEA